LVSGILTNLTDQDLPFDFGPMNYGVYGHHAQADSPTYERCFWGEGQLSEAQSAQSTQQENQRFVEKD
jgi:hypothetical protein